MQLVTLRISYPDNAFRGPGAFIYVKDNGRPIEAKVANRWIAVEGMCGNCVVAPGRERERLLLVRTGTKSCRLWLRYAGSSPSFKGRPFKGRVTWLLEHLPRNVVLKIPQGFGSGVGLILMGRAHIGERLAWRCRFR